MLKMRKDMVRSSLSSDSESDRLRAALYPSQYLQTPLKNTILFMLSSWTRIVTSTSRFVYENFDMYNTLSPTPSRRLTPGLVSFDIWIAVARQLSQIIAPRTTVGSTRPKRRASSFGPLVSFFHFFFFHIVLIKFSTVF
jgi:hypothetical protein